MSGQTNAARYLPAGDAALVVEFGSEISDAINDKVQAMGKSILDAQLPGVREVIPTFRSLMVTFDPVQTHFSALCRKLKKLEKNCQISEGTKKRVIKIPCCYGGAFGPDMADLAAHAGMSEQEVIAVHSGTDYRIYMMGFLPGFAYLGGLDKRLEMPRLKTPRVRILAGAVGIGGSQTGVYPLDSPGGWRLIGRTPLELYDPKHSPYILCHAGEYIRFVPISPEEYQTIREQVTAGTYQLETEEVSVC